MNNVMLGVPFGTRAAHVVQLRPIRVEQASRQRVHEIGEVATMFSDPAIFKKLERSGITAVSSTPEEFEAFFRKEALRWDSAFKESGIKLD